MTGHRDVEEVGCFTFFQIVFSGRFRHTEIRGDGGIPVWLVQQRFNVPNWCQAHVLVASEFCRRIYDADEQPLRGRHIHRPLFSAHSRYVHTRVLGTRILHAGRLYGRDFLFIHFIPIES